MKIRKVPADWLDAPRPRGRSTAGPRRKSNIRGKRPAGEPGKPGNQGDIQSGGSDR